MSVASRLQRLDAVLEESDLDALLVTNLTNTRWLSGFTGSNGHLLLCRNTRRLFTDSRYAEQATAELGESDADVEVVITRDPIEAIGGALDGHARLGLEADHVTWATQRRLADRTVDVELVPVDELIVGLRSVKDADEIFRMESAAAVADESLAAVIDLMRPGTTERAFAAALDQTMRERGADDPAFETIVAAGPNSARPHARPGERPFVAGDLVVVDVGATVGGYRSDMTRTFVLGAPTSEQQRQLEVVRSAQRAGIDAIAPGATCVDVDAACRSVIADAGWSEAFGHGAGHGVGLDIHELPRINSRSEDVLVADMVVTVEPGVYLGDRGGVRWEDLVLVTATGRRCLTGSPYDPVVAV
ncbi:MAG: Xaa-Pro peptidase family protein [Acidimicrobiia bacterium]|nr:Xaa-Pro peptidase family protein [Acidimicrobiia bacterium]